MSAYADTEPVFPEIDSALTSRLEHEAAMIAEGDADITAARTVSIERIRFWVEGVATDLETPVPQSAR